MGNSGHTKEKPEQKKIYELDFGGLPFRLRSSHDEKTVQELAHLVQGRLDEALAATKSGSFQSAAVLAALNIAEELILLKRKALKELDQIENRVERISQNLEKNKVLPPEAH
jgi:cell division protein ZapA